MKNHWVNEEHQNDIAIISMNGRYVGANTIDIFWDKIKNGIDLTQVEDIARDTNNNGLIKVKTQLENIDLFDATFFDYSNREAEIMDPQQRLFMECVWESLEKAGYNPEDYTGTIGLYGGCNASSYLMNNLLPHKELVQSMGDIQVMISNDKDHLTSQTAYKLNLKGPCMTVQTSCSTSLVAVHLGCESLLNGQCDIAIAGGVTIKIPQQEGYQYKAGGLVSEDGCCRPFDAQATGTVYSNGLGVVVLKRLNDAIEDDDTVHAVIKSSAINNDGADRVGYTAPGVNGQCAVISEALEVAQIHPESIGYIEAHGSGTPMGDAIEIEALTQAYGYYTDKKGYCGLGSVKSNIGHIEMAAGVTGLMKAALCVRDGVIPPSLHFHEPHPDTDWHNSPFYVNGFLQPWQTDGHPRRAGVSSFGLGGNNAHMIIEEPPSIVRKGRLIKKCNEIITISAQTKDVLYQYCETLGEHLKGHEEHHLYDVAYTFNRGRKRFRHRCAIPVSTREEMIHTLQNIQEHPQYMYESESINTKVYFVFQHALSLSQDQIQGLCSKDKEISQHIDRCHRLMLDTYGFNLKDILLHDISREYLELTSFIIQYAIAKGLMDKGLYPSKLVGEGIGLLVAATVACVLPLRECIERLYEPHKAKKMEARKGNIPVISWYTHEEIAIDSIGDSNYWEKIRIDCKTHPLESNKEWLLKSQYLAIGIEGLKLYGEHGSSHKEGYHNIEEKIIAIFCKLWLKGCAIDWGKYYADHPRKRIALPTYPFKRTSHWVNPPRSISLEQFEKERDKELVSHGSDTFVAIQQKVKSVWEKALGLTIEHNSDSFFNLGGHSLLATQILFTLKEIFKVDISLRSFLEQPFIEGLASSIWVQLEHPEEDEANKSSIPDLVIDMDKRYEPFNLTDVQKAYWIGRSEGMRLGNVSTHIYFEKDIVQLDHHIFSRIINQLIQRHDMLRAIIRPDGKQIILREVPRYDIRINQLESAQEEVKEAKLQEIRNTMSHQMISTDSWPLFDICLSQVSANKTRVHISFDLLITDAWGLERLLVEFMTLYQEPKHQLPLLKLSYRDYIQTLEAIKETRLYERSKNYWLNRLDTLPSAPQLPIQTLPSQIKTPHFKRYEKILDKDKWIQLKAEGKKQNITPTCILITAFSEVLTRWVSDPHFLINLTVFNRLPIHPQINEIVGDFTSLTLLEINNRIEDVFYERATRIQKQLWQDMDNRYFNGVEVTRELVKKTNDPSSAIIPIVFTSLLNVDNQEDKATRLDDRNKDEDVFVISQTPQVWLDHQVIERKGSLYLSWDILEDIFPNQIIDNMFDAYGQLLELLAKDSNQWCSKRLLHCVDKSMLHVLDKHKNEQSVEESGLHHLVNKQVQCQPHRTAVIYKDMHITYKELDDASNKVAAELIDKCIKEDDIIGILMDKGWEEVIAACGILKAGAAYLPLDKSLPKKRIEHLLKLGEVKCVIMQETSRKNAMLSIPLPVVTINKGYLNSNAVQPIVPALSTPDRLAYIIFTSGSTGEPKGVKMSHTAVANTLLDVNRRFSINNEDRILGLSSLSFDLSVYDIFGILIAGGTLIIPDSEQKQDPWEWYRLIQEYHITVWNSVPAFMKLFTEGLKVKKMNCPTLRLVMLSGDWIPVSLPHQICKLNNRVEIISLGGATEAAIWSIMYPIKEIDPQWKSIPYGYSMVNQCVYVLNNKLEICPTWVYGKLYIGGKGLANGYWKDYEKTKEKFITHPITGERLYHTGDIGRYLPDGAIELLGREDNQVKINGYRIELGEIESILKNHELVEDVITLAVEHADKKKIVSYVKTKEKEVKLPDDIIVDPIKRFEFKISEHQFRSDDKLSIPLKRFDHEDSFFKRRSYRMFNEIMIPLDTFSHFLGSMSLVTNEDKHTNKYMYGSSGGLYPVQLYLYVKDNCIENLAGGIYYYNPKEHWLTFLADTIIEPEVHVERNQFIFEKSAFSLFLIGEKKAIEPMYGKQESLSFMNLEAGMITQLLEMTSIDYHIGLCQIGSLDFNRIRKHFLLGDSHIYLHCLIGGHIDIGQIGKDAFMEEWGYYKRSLHSTKEQQTGNNHSWISQLKDYLTMHLPSYMIPTDIYRVDEFPITHNGKIDYKQLQKLEQPKLSVDSVQYIAPRNEMEYALSAIWQDVFQVEQVSVLDNFFDQGGDSILMIQIYNRLQEMGCNALRLIDLFTYPTIRLLADYIHTKQKEPVFDSAVDDEKRRTQSRRKRLQQHYQKNKNGE